MEINGTSEWEQASIPPNNLDIYVSFSVNDSEYISTYMQVDNQGPNRINPHCLQSIDSPPALGSGNISYIATTNDESRYDNIMSLSAMAPYYPNTRNGQLDHPNS